VTQRRLHELIGLLMTWRESRDPAPILARVRELADRVLQQSSHAIQRSLYKE
jgi:hypothetical protein